VGWEAKGSVMSAAAFADGGDIAFAFLRDLGRILSQANVIRHNEADRVTLVMPDPGGLIELMLAVEVLKRISREDAAANEERLQEDWRERGAASQVPWLSAEVSDIARRLRRNMDRLVGLVDRLDGGPKAREGEMQRLLRILRSSDWGEEHDGGE